MRLTALRFIMCFLGVAGLAQCGDEKSLSSKVKIQFLPENAIAVNTPFTVGDEEITPPWFLFMTEATNNSENTLTLVNYKFTINGFDGGTTTTTTASLALDMFCPDSRVYVAILQPGQTYRSLDTCDYNLPLGTGLPERWYIGGLPASSSNTYSVEIAAEGWFEDADGIPLERLNYAGFLNIQ